MKAAAGMPPMRAVGLAPLADGDGIVAAELRTDGCGLLGGGAVLRRPWSAAERAARAAGGAAALDLTLTALAEVLDGLAPFDAIGCDRLPAAIATALAEGFGCPVASDFAAADRRLGGRGGPMDAFFHHALLRHVGAAGPAAFLTLGPVCRLTWADASAADPALAQSCLAWEIGPGLPAPAGDGGAVDAGPGEAAPQVLAQALARPWFLRQPPKWLTGADFPDLDRWLAELPAGDAAATRRALVAVAALKALEDAPAPPALVLVGGPARRDPDLLRALAAALEPPLRTPEAAGIDGAALDAQALAYLAVRVLRGLPTSGPGTTGVAASVGGAEIRRPGG